MNALILDYLTVGGYSRAAASFAAEANLAPQQDNESVRIRQGIRHAIHDGKIREAIQALNDMDPEVTSSLPPLIVLPSFVGTGMLSYDYSRVSCTTLKLSELC